MADKVQLQALYIIGQPHDPVFDCDNFLQPRIKILDQKEGIKPDYPLHSVLILR
jgi:hypothetical protein